MARFDVHRPPDAPGYLLDVQSDHLWQLGTRMVVPLLPARADFPAIRDLNPLLRVGDEAVAMFTHHMAAVPRHHLGRPVANLLDQSDDITRALAILLTGF